MDDHTKPINKDTDNKNVRFVLSVLNQSSRSSSWMLNDGSYTIGRLENHEIILDDVTVSRNHAEIIIESNSSYMHHQALRDDGDNVKEMSHYTICKFRDEEIISFYQNFKLG